MAEDAGGGIRRSIRFAAETISTTAADVAGTVWNHLTQTQFTVDIDQAPKLIAALEEAIEELAKADRESERLRTLRTPGRDPYSGSAVLSIRDSAGMQEGGYGWANREARIALFQTIENIKRAVDTYRGADDAAREALKPKG